MQERSGEKEKLFRTGVDNNAINAEAKRTGLFVEKQIARNSLTECLSCMP